MGRKRLRLTDRPIEKITPNGIRAGGKEYAPDIIVVANGFDALTGPLKKLGIKGCGGRMLATGVGGRPADLSRGLSRIIRVLLLLDKF